jgi:single-strand DNA-binding protein
MRDVNKIILIGRLGADPAQKETKSGIAMVTFPLATSRKIGEEGEEETQWHRVITWGKQAEHCKQFLAKGNSVYVEGSVRTRKYDGKDGISRTTFEVHAESVSFLGGRKTTSSSSSRPSSEAGAEVSTSIEAQAG